MSYNVAPRFMKIRDIITELNGELLCGEDYLDKEVESACASDMMSDVLAFVKEQSVLVTGLCNPQVIRTAEMMDMSCIIFVRGKRPDSMVVDAAKAKGISLICVQQHMFRTCGILYAAGLKAEA